MNNSLLCHIKPYIQPFERVLAVRELEVLSCSAPTPAAAPYIVPVDYRVTTAVPASELAAQLAYWEFVEGEQRYISSQSLREATFGLMRNDIPLEQVEWNMAFGLECSLPKRRSLRYGPHGMHEYRGKFFPQLVRALINIAEVPADGVVADPMCGSGTTLVEAILSGRQAIGIDMNPLSAFVAHTKCSVMSLAPGVVLSCFRDVQRALVGAYSPQSDAMPYFESLPLADRKYLSGWFPAAALQGLDAVMQAIEGQTSGAVREVMLVSLSNIIRRVSWQMDDDLRVRKEILDGWEPNVSREFLEESDRTVRALLPFLQAMQGQRLGQFTVEAGDARDLDVVWGAWRGRVDAVITSPPYATALPYLDTDRLSLSYLGFLSRSKHRQREREMIGNREITESERRAYRARIEADRMKLPASVLGLIERIESLNEGTDAGFRRRNLPALLGKYFLDMREVLHGIAGTLKPGAPAYVVVGNNHTVAGGERVEIDTASLLADVAEQTGLRLCDRIPMEMLLSRDIFRKNASSAETILEFRPAAVR